VGGRSAHERELYDALTAYRGEFKEAAKREGYSGVLWLILVPLLSKDEKG